MVKRERLREVVGSAYIGGEKKFTSSLLVTYRAALSRRIQPPDVLATGTGDTAATMAAASGGRRTTAGTAVLTLMGAAVSSTRPLT